MWSWKLPLEMTCVRYTAAHVCSRTQPQCVRASVWSEGIHQFRKRLFSHHPRRLNFTIFSGTGAAFDRRRHLYTFLGGLFTRERNTFDIKIDNHETSICPFVLMGIKVSCSLLRSPPESSLRSWPRNEKWSRVNRERTLLPLVIILDRDPSSQVDYITHWRVENNRTRKIERRNKKNGLERWANQRRRWTEPEVWSLSVIQIARKKEAELTKITPKEFRVVLKMGWQERSMCLSVNLYFFLVLIICVQIRVFDLYTFWLQRIWCFSFQK